MVRRKGHGSSRKGVFLGFLLLLLMGSAGVLYVLNAEGTPPEVTIAPDKKYVGQNTAIQVTLRDTDSGLGQVTIVAIQDDERIPVVRTTTVQGEQWEHTVDLAELDLQEASFRLEVVATDNSWRRLGKGNIVEQDRAYTFDSTSPGIGIVSIHHNLNQGGSGMVAFSATEPLSRAGVQIGDRFFPAYQTQEQDWVCMFAYPYFAEPDEDDPVLVVEDRAENTSRTGFTHHVNARNFPKDRIRITDGFLQAKMPQYESQYPEEENLLDVFLQVNGPMRDENRARLRDFGEQTASKRLWQDRFLRLPDSARRASFGDQRTYFHKGEPIDTATHLGVDLASVARAKVPAANAGNVVFSDFLGIYGNVVVVDHGFGLQSLYAHLSKSNVAEGQSVSKGEILGKTGATGLAGGDHLHFAILISGQPVNPDEWWDQQWIEHNILSKWSLLEEKSS
ncbi:MAG: M23 family metallopeptidase [Thermodesulfobacteriota bacterium]